jgi:perosamine synthetase
MSDPVVNKSAPLFIPVAKPFLPPMATKSNLLDCVDGEWISSGPMVEAFERNIASAHFSPGESHGVACNSGTTALHLALAAIGVGPGCSVAIPTLTMVAVANAVLYLGGRPVFVDSRPSDGNMDGGKLVDAFERECCRTGVVAHLYGQPSDASDALRSAGFAGPIIQDCAECHYATNGNAKPLGKFANDLLTFSFYANKIIACGEGGMVATSQWSLADRMRRLRAHAFTPGNHFNHSELAYGYRMTDLQAAVGLAQHDMKDSILSLREKVANIYLEALAEIDWIEFPERRPGCVWWVFPVTIRRGSRVSVEAARESLADRGVETRRYFKPLHTQGHLTKYVDPGETFPVADDLYSRGFYLPLYPQLTPNHVEYIAQSLRNI